MISKSALRLVTSLREKKYRRETGLFIAEGEKVVSELLASDFEIHSIYATEAWRPSAGSGQARSEVTRVTPDELRKMSTLETPNAVLVVAKIPSQNVSSRGAKNERRGDPDGIASLPLAMTDIINKLILALDGIRDPGNLGTIIRTAEWFGVSHILASPDTVDVWNPKVVQSAMGSAFRVGVSYVDLPATLASLKKEGMPIAGAVLDGENVFEKKIDPRGVLVIGSESHGISDDVRAVLTERLLIPSMSPHIESLNAAIATAIVLAECRRG